MYLESFRRFEPINQSHEEKWWSNNYDLEREGWRLTTMKVRNAWFDEERNVTTWESVEVYDWRTGELLGEFDHRAFGELSYHREKWHDVEYYYELG
jgi:hypothetical protein